jgi:hypothetical protein
VRRKPNYRLDRAARERAKEAKRDEKLKRHQERAAQRGDDDAAEPIVIHECGEP